MSKAISPGSEYVITRDIGTPAGLAFVSGERVTVESLSPDPTRPDSKYVVLSGIQGKKFLLSDADLRPVPVEHPSFASAAAPGSPGDIFAGQPVSGSPSDVFAGQPLSGSPGDPFAPRGIESVFAGRAHEVHEEQRGVPTRYWIAGICVAVVIVAIAVFFIVSGGPRPPAGIPGNWKKYSALGLSIWLPPDYQVAYNLQDTKNLASNIKQPGALFDALGQLASVSSTAMVLSGIQPEKNNVGITSTCNLITEENPSGLNANDLIISGYIQEPADFTTVEKSTVKLGKNSAVKIVVQGDANTDFQQLEDVTYLQVNGGMTRQVTFGCNRNDFKRLQPDFQKSAASIS